MHTRMHHLEFENDAIMASRLPSYVLVDYFENEFEMAMCVHLVSATVPSI